VGVGNQCQDLRGIKSLEVLAYNGGRSRIFLSAWIQMKLHFISFVFTTILLAGIASCTPDLVSPRSPPISLASFTENYVDVSIYLESDSTGNYSLSATFTPPHGYHLYSKDIPLIGVDGLGRPTLLELTNESSIKTNGELTESLKAQVPNFEPKELLVYPPGKVTLKLPVILSPGHDWVDDSVKVTYMACNDSGCKPPVMQKIVLIRMPGADVFDNQWKRN
jgi:hypothetical protein